MLQLTNFCYFGEYPHGVDPSIPLYFFSALVAFCLWQLYRARKNRWKKPKELFSPPDWHYEMDVLGLPAVNTHFPYLVQHSSATNRTMGTGKSELLGWLAIGLVGVMMLGTLFTPPKPVNKQALVNNAFTLKATQAKLGVAMPGESNHELLYDVISPFHQPVAEFEWRRSAPETSIPTYAWIDFNPIIKPYDPHNGNTLLSW